jgi:hypothetical protein
MKIINSNENDWINSIKMSKLIKSWKFEMSSTHFACVRTLLSPTRDDTSCRRDVKRDRRLRRVLLDN